MIYTLQVPPANPAPYLKVIYGNDIGRLSIVGLVLILVTYLFLKFRIKYIRKQNNGKSHHK